MSETNANLPKFVYATAVTGQVVKIPLIADNHLDPGYFVTRLLDSGVPIDALDYISFSLEPPVQRPSRIGARGDEPRILPPKPKPASPFDNVPEVSEYIVNSFASLKEINEDQGRYCMLRLGGGDPPPFLNLFDYRKDWFQDPARYDEVYSGRIGLGYALQWKKIDRQTVSPGLEYSRTTTIKEGMSESQSLTITATVGASGFGVSASLSIAFNRTISINREQTASETFRLTGIEGKELVFVLWQLTELFLFLRKNDDGTYERLDDYRLVLLNKGRENEPYTVIDRFDGTMQLTNDTEGDTTSFDV